MTHNGVLIPTELHGDASNIELDSYAARVKQGNRQFIRAYHALEDAARALGVNDLEDCWHCQRLIAGVTTALCPKHGDERRTKPCTS